MDVLARQPDCDGQAADAVSTYTQVKMEDAPRLLRIPKSQNLLIFGHVYGRNLYGHPFAGLLWERQFEEVRQIGMSVCCRKQGLLFIGVRGRHTNGWKQADCGSHVEEIDEQTMILTNQLHFLITYTWDGKRAKLLFRG